MIIDRNELRSTCRKCLNPGNNVRMNVQVGSSEQKFVIGDPVECFRKVKG